MKITSEHFKRFQNACERLIYAAGLVHYGRGYIQDSKIKFAELDVDFELLQATFGLTSRDLSGQDMQIFRSPEHMAIHEVGHLLIAELTSLADEADVEKAEKEDQLIAQRLENLICSLLTDKQVREIGRAK